MYRGSDYLGHSDTEKWKRSKTANRQKQTPVVKITEITINLKNILATVIIKHFPQI
jgi:hypothetical protein